GSSRTPSVDSSRLACSPACRSGGGGSGDGTPLGSPRAPRGVTMPSGLRRRCVPHRAPPQPSDGTGVLRARRLRAPAEERTLPQVLAARLGRAAGGVPVL